MNIKTLMTTPTLNIQNKNILFESLFFNSPVKILKLTFKFIFSALVDRFFIMGYNVPHEGTMCPVGVQYALKRYNVTPGGTESKLTGYNVPFSRYVVLLF